MEEEDKDEGFIDFQHFNYFLCGFYVLSKFNNVPDFHYVLNS